MRDVLYNWYMAFFLFIAEMELRRILMESVGWHVLP